MSMETDLLVDRRRLRRKLSTWRLAAILLAALALIGIGLSFGGRGMIAHNRPHIARVQIGGLITGDQETLRLLDRVSRAPGVAGVVLSINSPGGTVTGSEALHEAIRKLADKKPTVAVVDGVAASGGYIAAIGTDYIVSRGGSFVGSIGVIAQFPNVSKLLDNVGVKVESIRSTPLKAQPSGLEPTSPEARAALESTVQDSYAWFKALVKTRRKLSDAELAAISDGRVFTGRQGLPLKLVDAIGGEGEGIGWLEREKHIAKDLPVQDWKRQDRAGRLPFARAMAELASLAGFEKLAMALEQGEALNSATLDGLLAVWQPAGQ